MPSLCSVTANNCSSESPQFKVALTALVTFRLSVALRAPELEDRTLPTSPQQTERSQARGEQSCRPRFRDCKARQREAGVEWPLIGDIRADPRPIGRQRAGAVVAGP